MTVSTKLFELVVPSGSDEVTSHLEGHPISTPSEWAGWVWYRNRPTWIEAEPEKSLDQLKPLSIHLLVGSKKSNPDSIVCFYPISSESGSSCLSSDFSLTASRISGDGPAQAACVIGHANSATDVNRLVAACVKAAREWLHKSSDLPSFADCQAEGPTDGVGFCTWSSLGENVHPTVDTINVLLDQILENQIPVQTWILDDGWQDQRTWDSGTCQGSLGQSEDRIWEKRGLSSFRASKACGDLSEMVKLTKSRLGSIAGTGRVDFGVWMALNGGYWDGIDPESELVKNYDCQRLTTSNHRIPHIEHKPVGSPPTSVWWLPRPDRAFQFWHDWFSYLKSCGVDFVKVDNQAKFVIVDGISSGEYHAAMWNGMVKAGDEIFGKGRIIHCMAHDEEMFGGVRGLGMATGGERFHFRNSDDFGYIHNNEFSHQRHLMVNITNSLLTSNLCVTPDADMFMTASQFPLAHALMRAFFPGPLLLSDHPGEHDLGLLQNLIALDKRGIWRVAKTTRAIQPLARRIQDLTIAGQGEGTGMWASVLMDNGGAAIPVWNTRHDSKGRVNDRLGREDVEDALGGQLDGQWAVYKHGLGADSSPSVIYVDNSWSGIGSEVELGEMECELFTIVPVVGEIALLGLTSLFAGLNAISRVTWSNNRVSMHVTLGGTLSLLTFGQSTDIIVKVDGLSVTPTIKPISSDARPAWRVDIEVRGGSGEDWFVDIELS